MRRLKGLCARGVIVRFSVSPKCRTSTVNPFSGVTVNMMATMKSQLVAISIYFQLHIYRNKWVFRCRLCCRGLACNIWIDLMCNALLPTRWRCHQSPTNYVIKIILFAFDIELKTDTFTPVKINRNYLLCWMLVMEGLSKYFPLIALTFFSCMRPTLVSIV